MPVSILKFLRSAPTDEILDVGKSIGTRAFKEGKANPKFFKTGSPKPAGGLEEIRKRYGVEFGPGDTPGDLKFRDLDSGVEYSVYTSKGRDVLENEGEWPGVERVHARIDPEGDYFSIYSGTSARGSGVGGRMYPAIWDAMFGGDKRFTRYTDMLTKDNAAKGALNELSAYIRHGENARMIPNPDQLYYSRLPQDVLMRHSPEAQMGVRLAESAARAEKGMPADVSADEALAHILSGGPVGVFGERSARLRSIVSDVLSGRDPESDKWIGVGGYGAGGRVTL